MTTMNRLSIACAAGLVAIAQQCGANPLAEGGGGPLPAAKPTVDVPLSAGAQSLGTRATVTSSATLYGGFELTTTATIYLLVRGNSLGTLGVTQNYLDSPRVRLFNQAGQDLIFDGNGNPGFNFCTTTGTFSAPVRSYYANTRGAPAVDNDVCTSKTYPPGVYTFTVTPSSISVPTFGEVLFEVTLNP